MAERARKLLDSDEQLSLTSVTFLETYFVLRTQYSLPRKPILDGIIRLIQKDNIVTVDSDKDYLIQGLGFCYASGRVSFGDALIWAAACSRSSHDSKASVYTFDQRFPSLDISLIQL
jgi:predicted nucleic-acid-binding protein